MICNSWGCWARKRLLEPICLLGGFCEKRSGFVRFRSCFCLAVWCRGMTDPSSCAFAPWAEGCRSPGQRPGVVVLFAERFCSLDNQITGNSYISTESKDLPEQRCGCASSAWHVPAGHVRTGGRRAAGGRGTARTVGRGGIALSPPTPSACREPTESGTG